MQYTSNNYTHVVHVHVQRCTCAYTVHVLYVHVWVAGLVKFSQESRVALHGSLPQGLMYLHERNKIHRDIKVSFCIYSVRT